MLKPKLHFAFFLWIAGVCAFAASPVVKSIDSEGVSGDLLSRITTHLKISVGDPIDTTAVDEGIRKSLNEGWVRSLNIYTQSDGDGVRVTVVATPVQSISKITFLDIDKEIIDGLSGKWELQEGKTVDSRLFQAIRTRLTDAYRVRGYLDAQVAIELKETVVQGEVEIEVRGMPKEPTRIKVIRMEGGDPADHSLFLKLIKLKKGDILDQRRLDENVSSIERYLKSNQYLTSKVESEVSLSEDRKEAVVVFRIRGAEKFQFEFDGASAFDEVQLRQLVTDDIIAQPDFVARVQEAIEKKLRNLGYHFCQVKAHVEQIPAEHRTAVRFEIQEGSRVIIDRLEFSTGGDIGKDELSKLFYDGASGVVARHIYSEVGVREATDRLSTELKERGYHRVRLSLPRTVFSEDKKGVQLFIDIDLGHQALVNAIQFEGVAEFAKEPITNILREANVSIGEPLVLSRVSAARKKIKEYYSEQGYVDAKLAETGEGGEGVVLSPDGARADAVISVNEGTQYFLGNVRVEGNRRTEPRVILREMKLHEGEKYSPRAVAQSEDAILLLGIFSRVEVTSTPSTEFPNRKDLVISVIETKPGIGEVGFGLAYEDPRFRTRAFSSVAYRNLLGLNHTASGRAEVILPISPASTTGLLPFVEYLGVLSYRSPFPFEIPVIFTEEVSVDSFEVQVGNPQTLQKRVRLEARLEKKISDHFTFFYRLHTFENATISETYTSPTAQFVERTTTIGSTGPGFSLDLRNDAFNPSRGSLHLLNLEFAHPALLSQTSPEVAFALLSTRHAVYFPFLRFFQAALSLGAGYAKSLSPGAAIPLARLRTDLSLGGQSTIRGHSTRALAPPDTAEETGYYNLRSEISAMIFTNFSLAAFGDCGQLLTAGTPSGFYYGLGLGIRYKTPVGPLVLDLAKGFGPTGEVGIKFYFTVGSI